MFEGKSERKGGQERNKNARVSAFLLYLGCYRPSAWFYTLRPIKPDALVNDIEFDNSIFLRISDHTHRIETVLNIFNLLFEKFSQQYDAFIANTEPLLSSISHLTLGFPSHRVLRGNHSHVVLP